MTKKIKMFQFNNCIDATFIESMYENDYLYVEEIFRITLSSFESDLNHIEKSLELRDKEAVRKGIHKIKSAIGFIGMLNLQNLCHELETKCSLAPSLDGIRNEIETLIKLINEHHLILKNEYQRIKTFNLGTKDD